MKRVNGNKKKCIFFMTMPNNTLNYQYFNMLPKGNY